MRVVLVGVLSPQPPVKPGPAWDIARLFPDQGQWGEGDYLELNRRTNNLVELSDGHIEVLDMPTRTHQRIVLFLYNALVAFVGPRKLGELLVAPYPVKLRQDKFREPDIIFMLTEHAHRMREDYAECADLVIEVLSENRSRDLETKRAEYAQAGIPEYWIVDPRERQVIILRLSTDGYAIHADSKHEGRVSSALLPGFALDAAHMFTSIEGNNLAD